MRRFLLVSINVLTMNNAAQANNLRNQINLLAAEYRAAEKTETWAELRCRMGRIIVLEKQLTAVGVAS